MEKALQILEKNVQWLVLGLAAAFLGWVAYAYVVTPPAQVKVGSRTVLPGEIAGVIADGPAKTLEKKIKDDRANFTTPDLVASWQSHMSQPPSFALLPYAQDLPQGKGTITDKDHLQVRIAGLPTFPQPVISNSVLAGRSVISTVPAGGAAPPQPANPNVPVAQQGRDLEWVMVSATIPAKALADALLAPLKGQTVDPTLYNSQLLEVTLERQQSNGFDAMGNPTFPAEDGKTITKVAALIVDPTQVMPLPDPKSDLDTKYKFLDWSAQHVDLIATPPFYQVVTGTPFAPPAAPVAPENGQTPGVAPGTAPASAPATAPATAPVTAPESPATPAAAPAPAAGVTPTRPPVTASYIPNGLQPPPDVAGPPMINGNGQQGGQINPYSIPNDILIYAFDQDVKPGQFYRYRLRYSMKNPVFAIKNLADDKLIDQFALQSQPSAWTPAVKVPETTQYWVASVSTKMDQAKMDVFHWSNGQWSVKHMNVAPGETLPGTDMTVVDIRSTDSRQRDKYVLLAAEDGKSYIKSVAKDAADGDYQDLQNQVNTPSGTGAPGTPPGTVIPPITPRGLPPGNSRNPFPGTPNR